MVKRPNGARAIAAALAIAGLVLGCVFDPGGGDGAGGAGGGAGPLEGTDAQVCGAACDALIGCGASIQQTDCKADCLAPQNASLVTCFRSVAAACDPLASCVWGAVCQGSTPSGSQSCGQGEECLAACGGNPNELCPCTCAGQVSPAAAGELYVLLTCAFVRCSIECGQSGDPVSCDGCLTKECSAAAAQCN